VSLVPVHNKRRKGSVVGGTMASAEHEPITGVWGQSPQQGAEAEPLVRGSGGQSPPEAESILVIGCPTEPANLAPVRENGMLCYGPLVSELGGQSAWCPQPRHWGACAPPPAPPPMSVHEAISESSDYSAIYMQRHACCYTRLLYSINVRLIFVNLTQ